MIRYAHSFVAEIRTESLADASEAAAAVVGGGGIALVRLGPESSVSDARDLIDALGAVVAPASMPAGLDLNVATRLTSIGPPTHGNNWHIDQSFLPKPPTFSSLFALELTGETAGTAFCDGAALFAALSSALGSVLRNLSAEHVAYDGSDESFMASEMRSLHSCVRLVQGDVPTLFLAPATVSTFAGWTRRESLPLLGLFWEMMNWPEFGYTHRWSRGDLLIWPNLRYPHRTLSSAQSGTRKLVRFVGQLAELADPVAVAADQEQG